MSEENVEIEEAKQGEQELDPKVLRMGTAPVGKLLLEFGIPAIVEVADPRLDKLAEIVHPQQIIRATVEFTDIAGLVKGASKGEGLGNKFLANIRECDAILHVVR